MKMKFLGTGAAEGFPGIFCQCDTCIKASSLGGKDIRTRSSCLIDDEYMMDFPPDTYMHKLTHGLDLWKLKHVIFTHSHEDHCAPIDLLFRHGAFAHIKSMEPLQLYGNESVGDKLNKASKGSDLENSIKFNLVKPFNDYKIGSLTVTPLPAYHDKTQLCHVYIIEKEGKKIFYGHDSGYYEEETWAELVKHHFDLVILDCTSGPLESYQYHMGLSANRKVKERLVSKGAADESTKFVVTHFSHNGGLLHHELQEAAAADKFIVAYDGMEIEL